MAHTCKGGSSSVSCTAECQTVTASISIGMEDLLNGLCMREFVSLQEEWKVMNNSVSLYQVIDRKEWKNGSNGRICCCGG